MLPHTLLTHAPWVDSVNPIWIASSFVLHRNLAQYPFPLKMSDAQLSQSLPILQNLLTSSQLLEKPVAFDATHLDPSEREFLFEHFLCLEGFQNTLKGQAFVLDRSNLFLGILNLHDHLHLQWIDYQGNWEKTWEKLNQLDNEIGSQVELAYHPRFGYLSSQPNLSGTGLVIHVYLHLPALVHTEQLADTLIKHKPEEVTVTSLQGQELIGDLVVLKNTFTLGVNEENILHSLHLTAMRLMTIERALRTQLKQSPATAVKDLVSRSFGLLAHSYQIQTKEAMQALSLLKLGLDLGWVNKTTHGQLNASSFLCRRAHLMHQLGKLSCEPEELPHRRAEWLHPLIQQIQLTI